MQHPALSFLFFLRTIRAIPKVKGLIMKLMRHFSVFSNHVVTINVFDGVKMKLNLNDLVQQHLFAHGYYEPAETALWKHCVKNANVIADIGANVGYYSLLSAKYGKPTARIFSFEPMNHIRSRTKENIVLNSFSNINLFPLAVSNKKSKQVITLPQKSNWGGAAIVHSAPASGVHSEEIETTTLDSFVSEQEVSSIDMVKMDIEGYELFALQGMKETLRNFKPLVFVEVLDYLLMRFNYTAADIFNFFEEIGYNGYMILPNQKLQLLEKPTSYDGLILFAQPDDSRIQSLLGIKA